MPNNTEETLDGMSDADLERLAIKMDELGITDKVNAIFRFSACILEHTVNFMKRIGVLNEFVQSLSGSDRLTFTKMYENRPKMYGGNPFA